MLLLGIAGWSILRQLTCRRCQPAASLARQQPELTASRLMHAAAALAVEAPALLLIIAVPVVMSGSDCWCCCQPSRCSSSGRRIQVPPEWSNLAVLLLHWAISCRSAWTLAVLLLLLLLLPPPPPIATSMCVLIPLSTCCGRHCTSAIHRPSKA
jgi:hypothetical protein